MKPAQYYEERNVELRLGVAASAIEPARRELELAAS